MKTVTLQEVAPAEPARLSLRPTDVVWQLNLDQIEAQSGRILKKVTNTAERAGTSTLLFDSGNVLYSKLRPYLNKVVCPDSHGIATTELVPLRPNPARLDRRYLTHYLRSQVFVSWASNEVDGAKMPRVSMKAFWKHSMPLPPLPEQRRIVEILDAADDLRARRRNALNELNALVQSAFIDMFGDPVINPKRWKVGVIGDLLQSVTYGTSKKANPERGSYPILRMNNITYTGAWDFSELKYIDLNPKELSKYSVRKGHLLFNRTNSKELVGKTAVYRRDEPMTFAGYLVRGVVNSEANSEYIGAFMNTASTKKYLQNKCKNIIGMANINAKEFAAIPIAKPPVALQHQFAAIVEAVEKQRQAQRDHLEELDGLFASLRSRAFKGEL